MVFGCTVLLYVLYPSCTDMIRISIQEMSLCLGWCHHEVPPAAGQS